MTIVKIECPKCGQHVETDSDTASIGLVCPACQNSFRLPPPDKWPDNAPRTPAPAKMPKRPEWMDIREHASNAQMAGKGILLLGFAIVCCCIMAEDGFRTAMICVGSGLIVAAFWLTILAQIMHVRAAATRIAEDK